MMDSQQLTGEDEAVFTFTVLEEEQQRPIHGLLKAARRRNVQVHSVMQRPLSVGSRRVGNSAEPAGSPSAHIGPQSPDKQLRRLECELHSLREAYAHKIARTEMKCEGMLQAKDKEVATWNADKHLEIKKMRATVTIMGAVFDKRRQRLTQRMEDQEAEFFHEKQQFDEVLAETERGYQDKLRLAEEEARRQKEAHDQQLHAQARELEHLQGRLNASEEQLRVRTAEAASLREELAKTTDELSEVQRRLEEVSQVDALARLQLRNDDLEAELAKTKERAKEKARRDARTFNAELMQYVKCILHLLPEDQAASWERAGPVPLEEVLQIGCQAPRRRQEATRYPPSVPLSVDEGNLPQMEEECIPPSFSAVAAAKGGLADEAELKRSPTARSREDACIRATHRRMAVQAAYLPQLVLGRSRSAQPSPADLSQRSTEAGSYPGSRCQSRPGMSSAATPTPSPPLLQPPEERHYRNVEEEGALHTALGVFPGSSTHMFQH